MTASSLAPEFSLIMEKFLSLSERVAENWEEEKADTSPELLIRAAEQLYDMMSHLGEEDRVMQEDIDIDQCCDYGLHLFDEQSDLAQRCGLDDIAEQIEDLCFPFCLWATRHHATISHLQPVVNALSRKANGLRDPGALSSLFTQVNEIMDLTLYGHPHVKTAVDMACWDILGKARNRPVYALLGGKMNDRVRAYTYLYPLPQHDTAEFWVSPEMAAAAAVAGTFVDIRQWREA